MSLPFCLPFCLPWLGDKGLIKQNITHTPQKVVSPKPPSSIFPQCALHPLSSLTFEEATHNLYISWSKLRFPPFQVSQTTYIFYIAIF